MDYKKIKSFEDACRVEKINPKNLPIVSKLPKKEQAAIIANYKLTVITSAINRILNNGKQWKPDLKDSNQWKYYPWFHYKSGFGFSYYYWASAYSSSDVGFRLVFKTSDAAEYAGKKFLKLYKASYIIS